VACVQFSRCEHDSPLCRYGSAPSCDNILDQKMLKSTLLFRLVINSFHVPFFKITFNHVVASNKCFKKCLYFTLSILNFVHGFVAHPTSYSTGYAGLSLAMGCMIRVSNPDWGRNFPCPSTSVLRPIHPPVHWVPGFFPGGKAAGAWR
jgi:hypothetical protein